MSGAFASARGICKRFGALTALDGVEQGVTLAGDVVFNTVVDGIGGHAELVPKSWDRPGPSTR